MQMVRHARTFCRRHHISIRYERRSASNDRIMMPASTTLIPLHQFAKQQRRIHRRQPKFRQQTLIHHLHLLPPVSLAIVAASLMHKNALDDTHLLRPLSALHQSAKRIIAIFSARPLQPVRRRSNIFSRLLLLKKFNSASPHSHVNHPHPHAVRQVSHHSPPKIIRRRQPRVVAAQRRIGNIPFPLLPPMPRHIHRRHHAETRVNTPHVLILNTSHPLHVRLPEAQIHMKIRVKLRRLLHLPQSANPVITPDSHIADRLPRHLLRRKRHTKEECGKKKNLFHGKILNLYNKVSKNLQNKQFLWHCFNIKDFCSGAEKPIFSHEEFCCFFENE